MLLRRRRRPVSSRAALADLASRLPPAVARAVSEAASTLRALEDQRDAGASLNAEQQATLLRCRGVFEAARSALDGQELGVAWAQDPERLQAVFVLEAKLYEGVALREQAAGPGVDERLAGLREAVKRAKA